MASFEKAMTKDLFDGLLPVFGTPRKQIPIWDEGQKMFLVNQYQSASNNFYYEGIRFSNNLVIKENNGKYHTWTYIDSIEIYAFDGKKLKLIQRRDYNKQFRSEEFVRQESQKKVADYLAASLKSQGTNCSDDIINEKAKEVVENSFVSFLDTEFTRQLPEIIPQLRITA